MTDKSFEELSFNNLFCQVSIILTHVDEKACFYS